MNIVVPIKVDIRAKSSSGFTLDIVEIRLADLAARQAAGDDSVSTEIEYLRALKKRKWGA